jgi:hypothetical protein
MVVNVQLNTKVYYWLLLLVVMSASELRVRRVFVASLVVVRCILSEGEFFLINISQVEVIDIIIIVSLVVDNFSI